MKTASIFDYKEDNGLVFCHLNDMAKNNMEILYMNEASQLSVDAVLFRRYYKEGEDIPYKSEPAVCIFNKSDHFFDTAEHLALHASIWSAANYEVYIIKGQTRIDIINARKPAEYNYSEKRLSIATLALASQAIEDFDYRHFSAYLFGSGTFWEQKEFENQLDADKTPYILLLSYLLETRSSFKRLKNINLTPALIDKILIVCILIKFLEEREDDNGKHTLKNIYEKLEIRGLSEAINRGVFLTVINELASEFNGKIFDNFTIDEKTLINKSQLQPIADFLTGSVNAYTRQAFIWKQYDFKYLPAEVISAIYENFIQEDAKREIGKNEKGIVYTPIHLVNFLIDEAMPLDKPELFKNERFKVLDPACGSGVFLVAAYKRLLQWWAINNSSNGQIRYPQSIDAVKILEENIFGVDIKGTATLVTIFGLTIALLDKLTPKEIWNNLQFSDLSIGNIQHGDFFSWSQNSKAQKNDFDLVIGNPPFNPINGKSKKDIVTDERLKLFNVKSVDLPRNNFALKFFEGAKYWGKIVCMIIPSNILLYDKASLSYRKRLFTEYTVHKIFDFTHLRRELFHNSADTPVLAVLLENKPSLKQPIEHTVIKRMLSSEKKIGFEIDYYDKHFVRWEWAIDEGKFFIWKANLLGGGRLFHFIYRLSLLPTLGSFIKAKQKSSNWKFSIGYIVGSPKQSKKADYITNRDYVIRVDEKGQLVTEKEVSKTFEAIREKELFTPPFLLIKDVVGEHYIPTYFIESYNEPVLTFRRNYTGISAPKNDIAELTNIYNCIKSKYANLYRFSVMANSASVLVKQETYLNKEDIEGLPFTEDEITLSYTEQILQDDILNFYVHLGKAINKNATGNIFQLKANDNQLNEFGIVFCAVLNDRYARNGKSWQSGEIIFKENYYIYQFGFGKNNEIKTAFYSKVENIMDPLIENIFNAEDIYKRVLRLYQHINGFDCVFLIKPIATRYWLKSIALKDADDTFANLKREGF